MNPINIRLCLKTQNIRALSVFWKLVRLFASIGVISKRYLCLVPSRSSLTFNFLVLTAWADAAATVVCVVLCRVPSVFCHNSRADVNQARPYHCVFPERLCVSMYRAFLCRSKLWHNCVEDFANTANLQNNLQYRNYLRTFWLRVQ